MSRTTSSSNVQLSSRQVTGMWVPRHAQVRIDRSSGAMTDRGRPTPPIQPDVADSEHPPPHTRQGGRGSIKSRPDSPRQVISHLGGCDRELGINVPDTRRLSRGEDPKAFRRIGGPRNAMWCFNGLWLDPGSPRAWDGFAFGRVAQGPAKSSSEQLVSRSRCWIPVPPPDTLALRHSTSNANDHGGAHL